MKEDNLGFFKMNFHKILLSVLGVIAAVLFLTIGFWKTLLILVLYSTGFAFGFILDRDGTEGLKRLLIRFIELFGKKD